MCGSTPSLAPDKPTPPKASLRAKTATEIRRPKGQLKSQSLAARLGTAQLRAPLAVGS
jgi:hypothetical protein